MSFGADTDYWSFADTNWELQGSTETPNKSEAQAVDSNGDATTATMYDCYVELSATYRRCNDTAFKLYDTAAGVDFRLGKVISSNVITSIGLTTENTGRPEIVISGRACPSADSDVNKYDPSDLEIAGTRKATPIGVTADTGTNITGASATASVDIAVVLDSVGQPACADVYGGRVEASNDLVGATAAPSATADTGWTVGGGPSEDRENTGYATGSITVFKNLTQM